MRLLDPRGGRIVRALVWSTAAAGALGSAAFYGSSRRPEARDVGEPELSADSTVAIPALGAAAPPAWRWSERSSHPGSHASRDLFSPPECWRDPAGLWVRGPAPAPAADAGGAADPGSPADAVRVIGIVRRCLPWQLVGYAGGDTEPVGLFEDVASGEVSWRRSGGSLGEGTFRVASLTVHLSAAPADVPGAAPVRVARAVLLEKDNSGVHELCTAERRGVGHPRVELQLSAQGPVHLLAAGERIVAGGAVVEVAEVDAAAGRVVVHTSGPGGRSPSLTADRVPVRWRLAWSGEAEDGR